MATFNSSYCSHCFIWSPGPGPDEYAIICAHCNVTKHMWESPDPEGDAARTRESIISHDKNCPHEHGRPSSRTSTPYRGNRNVA